MRQKNQTIKLIMVFGGDCFLRTVYCTHIFPPPPPGWMTRGIMGGLGREM